MINLLDKTALPDWFSYPDEFITRVQTGELDIGPWRFLQGDFLALRHTGLRQRYPERDLVPFARRIDSDDVACWDVRGPGHVYVVHDFAAPGWEERDKFGSFAEWHAQAVEDARDYEEE
ncbi:MAG TPA: hypothetical protein VIT92_06435 [Burkholderiaceae bacterium]